MPGRLEFDLNFGRPAPRRDESDPMRLLVLGDFSGKPAAERPPLATRPTQKVDLDNVDEVMRRWRPRVTVAAGEIPFEHIDDFHPDRLYARLDLFKALREARVRPPAEAGDMLGRLIGKSSEAGAVPAAAPRNPIDSLIHNIVAPYVVKDTSAETGAYVAAVDTAIAEQMRLLLHDPAFQSVEAAWRGVHWLISNLELDEHLQLHLFDVTREELMADIVGAQGKLANTGVYRTLVDKWRNVPGGQGWSALFGLMSFGPSDADIGLLAALGLIASQAGGPWMAGAGAALASGDPVPLAGWPALRRSEAARWIGLAAPRVLLRLPYGRASDRVESFGFEEFVGPPAHEEFLWGSPSLALAILIGRSFTSRGWDLEPGDEREIGDLPAYTFVRDGEREMQPAAERFLTESQIQSMLQAGLIPIASRRDSHAVVAIRFQSIADPPAPLAW
jgi:predicted component of type VI protein secretion system